MSNTKYYAGELMVYFEKHRLLEVIRVLIIRLCLDRPRSLKHYVRRYLRKIANTVLTKNTIIHLPMDFDVGKFVKAILETQKIPVISYNTHGREVTPLVLREILCKFEKFCRNNGLQKKNKIYLNMPKTIQETMIMENSFSPPTDFIHVNMGDKPRISFQNVLDFYCCKKQVFPDFNVDPDELEKSVIPEIMHKIKFAPRPIPFSIDANFKYRALFIGRRGTGRKTHAKMLAVRYNLVYITISDLIQQTLTSKDNMANVLCVGYKHERKFSSSAIVSLLWKRLLKNDAMARGWVIVGFPRCANELRTMVTKFQTPPNRIVVFHCNRDICLRRLIKMWESNNMPSSNKHNTVPCVEKDFDEYDHNAGSIYKYLKESNVRTIHVNASCCPYYVKNKIFSLMERM